MLEHYTPHPIRVCVTGGTGFVVLHLIYQLLLKGYHVNTTMRNVSTGKPQIIQALLNYHSSDPENSIATLSHDLLEERLTCFNADLNQEGSFEKAIQHCQFVHHTASPVALDVKDPQKELVVTAVQGTMNVLRECVKLRKWQQQQQIASHDRLQRIIVTSSMAAVVDTPEVDKIYTEKDWNEISSVHKNPYYYSKVCAEKAAWEFMEQVEQEEGKDFLEMVTILPSTVTGESILSCHVSVSHEMVKKITEFPALVALTFEFIHVKDVARAHVLSMESKTLTCHPSKRERFLICGETVTLRQVIEFMREHFKAKSDKKWFKKMPTLSLEGSFGSGLIKVVAALFESKDVIQYLNSNIGKPLYFDTSKAKKELGMDFKDWKSQIVETIEFLIKHGYIKGE